MNHINTGEVEGADWKLIRGNLILELKETLDIETIAGILEDVLIDALPGSGPLPVIHIKSPVGVVQS